MKKLPFSPKIIGSSIAALVIAMPLSGAIAADKYWVDSKGEAVMSGTGECVNAINGMQPDACMPKMEEPAAVVYGDADNDGVTDDKDNCPGTMAGAMVDATGCTMDSDNDGVVDGLDMCANTPAGLKVNAKGCATKVVVNDLSFELNSSVLTAESKANLDKSISRIKSNPNVKHVTITGHTDSTGAAEYNQMLSEKRAKAVGDYFVASGVPADMVTTQGKGESMPVADNTTAIGRNQNRRVEFDIEYKQ